ncbi:MAG: fatty acid desaturase family protein [Candidatus Parcubacteria bacterium]|nr:fatty acid desaturase family protein [Burkholderiales bacterium]
MAASGEEFKDDFRKALPGELVQRLSRISPWRSAWSVLQEFLAIGLLVAAALYWWTPWVVVPCVILIGTRQHALFVLAHEAAHYRLFEGRRLNDLAGRLCATLQGLSMRTYRVIHRLHHNNLYTELDPDTALHGGYPRGKAYLAKKLLKDLTGFTAWKTYAYFLGGAPALNTQTRQALRPLDDTSGKLREEARSDRNTVVAFHLVALIAFGASGFLVEYLALWILPLVTVVQAILRLRAIAEHGATTDFSSPLTAARTNLVPAWLGWLVFPHHVNYHIEHHLYASVPQYHLPALHRELASRGLLEAAEVLPFGATLRKIFAARVAARA